MAVQVDQVPFDVAIELLTVGETLGNGVIQDVLQDFSKPVVGLVVVFAVTLDPNLAHRPPPLQLPDTHAGTALADMQRLLHVVQPPRLPAEVEIGIDLPNDAPQPEGLSAVAGIGNEMINHGSHGEKRLEAGDCRLETGGWRKR